MSNFMKKMHNKRMIRLEILAIMWYSILQGSARSVFLEKNPARDSLGAIGRRTGFWIPSVGQAGFSGTLQFLMDGTTKNPQNCDKPSGILSGLCCRTWGTAYFRKIPEGRQAYPCREVQRQEEGTHFLISYPVWENNRKRRIYL